MTVGSIVSCAAHVEDGRIKDIQPEERRALVQEASVANMRLRIAVVLRVL